VSRFRAPWSTALKVVSGLGTLLLTGVAAALVGSDPPEGTPRAVTTAIAALLVAVVAVAALLSVRGYVLTPGALLVERLFWRTSLPLHDIRSARRAPELLRRSVRMFGNGGLFSFSGLFAGSRVGRYRAFATDPRRAVLLEFPDRKVLVTPESPSAFLEALSKLHPEAEIDRRDD
jgi:hypothetical protein